MNHSCDRKYKHAQLVRRSLKRWLQLRFEFDTLNNAKLEVKSITLKVMHYRRDVMQSAVHRELIIRFFYVVENFHRKFVNLVALPTDGTMSSDNFAMTSM